MDSIMEAIKFLLFYSMEVVVVAVVGVTVLAGLYQLVRDRLQERRVAAREAAQEVVKHS